MFSFGKRSIVFVLILFIIIAVVGWAWRQRDSLPFITKPLQTIASPFEYGASNIVGSLASGIHIIDVGSGEGVEKDMPVITPNGVVGFISDVYPHSARVQLLTDPRTSIGAIVQRPESRVSSVVRGNGNVPTEPQFVNIAKDADILEGDTLVTSGFGSIYPKGLPLGTIVSIHQNDNDFVKYAVIRPSVDFSKLEEVLVILKSSDTGSYAKPDVAPKLVPQTNRDKVEGIKGAAAL